MAGTNPTPGQTVTPEPNEKEMAVKIDHGSAGPAASQPPVKAAPAASEPVQAVPAETEPQPTKPESIEPEAAAAEVEAPTQEETLTQAADYGDQEATDEDYQPQESPERFNFVNDEPEEEKAPISGEFQWTASEFIAHEKSAGWYLALFAVATAIAVGVFIWTKDKVSIFIIYFAAFVLAYFASHKPREMNYAISPDGIDIGSKHYSFNEFKSFGLVPEGAFTSIMFMPHKRFAIPLSIYYPPEDEAKIAELIGSYLPFEEHSKDAIDKLLRAIRF